MCNYGGKKKGFDLTSQMDLERVSSILGEGPYRFAPPEPERKLQQQLDSLSVEEKECVDALIDKWDANHPADPLPDELVLRSARNSHEPFHKKQAWNAMKVIQRPKTMGYLSLSAVKMEKQLSTGTLFPLPGMNTKNNHEVLYMKPSRYVPSETPTKAVLNNLAYCMNSMYEKESTSRDGIAFLANMDDWTMNKHFATEYCLKVSGLVRKCDHSRVVRLNSDLKHCPFPLLKLLVYEHASGENHPGTRQSFSYRQSKTLVQQSLEHHATYAVG